MNFVIMFALVSLNNLHAESSSTDLLSQAATDMRWFCNTVERDGYNRCQTISSRLQEVSVALKKEMTAMKSDIEALQKSASKKK